MKKILLFLLIFTLTLPLVSCGEISDPPHHDTTTARADLLTPHSVFRATVIEVVIDTYFLVEPKAGSIPAASASRIYISIETAPSPVPKVGNIIEIVYNGEILETYPAQITGVAEIRIVEQ